jgi:hypothetical protein
MIRNVDQIKINSLNLEKQQMSLFRSACFFDQPRDSPAPSQFV